MLERNGVLIIWLIRCHCTMVPKNLKDFRVTMRAQAQPFLFLFLNAVGSNGCSNLLVSKGASVDGSTILTYNVRTNIPALPIYLFGSSGPRKIERVSLNYKDKSFKLPFRPTKCLCLDLLTSVSCSSPNIFFFPESLHNEQAQQVIMRLVPCAKFGIGTANFTLGELFCCCHRS